MDVYGFHILIYCVVCWFNLNQAEDNQGWGMCNFALRTYACIVAKSIEEPLVVQIENGVDEIWRVQMPSRHVPWRWLRVVRCDQTRGIEEIWWFVIVIVIVGWRLSAIDQLYSTARESIWTTIFKCNGSDLRGALSGCDHLVGVRYGSLIWIWTH